MTALDQQLADRRAARQEDGIKPGVHENMPEGRYHADPVRGGSLSASGVKDLLPPSCPALYRWYADHPRVKAEFDFGHAAHREVLGVGAEVVILRKTDRKTSEVTFATDRRAESTKAHEAEIRAAGGVPMLAEDWRTVQEMAAAIRRDPLAPFLLDPTLGRAEVTLVARDPETGVMLRSRVDWLLAVELAGVIASDYKTTTCAEPSALARQMYGNGYHIQAAFYLYVLRLLGRASESSRFLFFAQEKTPPYLTTFYEPDAAALDEGYARVREGIERYRDCTESGVWPGYTTDVVRLSLPRYATYRSEEY